MTDLRIPPCDICGTPGIHEEIRREEFLYGMKDEAVTLSADVPVWVCDGCGFSFTDHRGEDARHEAVCKHLGVLAPKDIVAIREQSGLSRAAFADVLGFGIASLQRWETGSTIQNTSSDNLIRLSQNPMTLKALQQRRFNGGLRTQEASPRLDSSATLPNRFCRFPDPRRIERQAEHFVLRPRRRQCIS
jgi:putative zinc finger/helix-turn-helix YgiT family protein